MRGDFYLGAWLVQPSLGRLSLDGRTVQVRPKVMDLLVYLAGSPGEVVSKETLLNQVWRSEAISESALTRTITELRSALADDVSRPRFLETIPKRGYRLTASVRPVESVEARRRARAPALATGLGAVLLAGSILLVFEMKPAEPTEPPRVMPLTSSPGQEGQPAFSPDGTRVAFVWSGEADDNFDIYVKRIEDDTPVRLTTDPGRDQSPAWSADGRTIAFARATPVAVGVYVVPAAGGGERFLGNLRRPLAPTTWMAPRGRILDWFPDGRTLAVADQDSSREPFQIFTLAIDTGERRRLTSPPPQSYGDGQPDVSPDGRTVAFTRALARDSPDVHVVPATGGEPRRLTFDGSVIIGLAWTEDGGRIVFSSERGATAGAGSLWTVPASGSTPEGKLQQVQGVGPRAIVPAIGGRRGLLAYQESFQDTNLWRVPVDGGGAPQRLSTSTREENQPDYSRDGSRIAFASNRTGNWEIWVAHADGSLPRQVTTFAGAPAMNPRWSPNDRLIAFSHADDGNADIYTINPEGSSIRRLTLEPSRDETPSWSQDGRWLYFSSNRSGTFEVWKLEANGSGRAMQLTHGGGTNPVESPDGRRLYYRKATSGLTIYRTPVNGGDETHVLGPIPRAPTGAWVPDSDGIYLIEPWQITYYRFATGRTTPIVTLPEDSIIVTPGLSLSPDGRWLLFGQRDRVGSDIMLVEGFR